MTLARALAVLLAVAAALAGQEQDCVDRQSLSYTTVPCDGLTERECRQQSIDLWDASGDECCSGYRGTNFCQRVGTDLRRCITGCVEIPISVSVGASSVTLTLDRAWGQYSGTTALTWEGGSGASVTLTVAEFSPTSGPTLSAGDLRARTTAGLASWTALAASTSYTVVPASSAAGTETVSWAVRDRPSYSTGAYSATATFTISEP